MKKYHRRDRICFVDTYPVAEQSLVTCEILDRTWFHRFKLFVADRIVSYISAVHPNADLKISKAMSLIEYN